MSVNYTCNQFDKAYKPTKLGNWEVPKWHLNRPKGRSTVTRVIANDRGHLLPGVQKTDQKHWAGLYMGTYQLPKRISKEDAIELSSPKCQTWMKRSYHHPFIDRSNRNKNEDNKLENINTKEHSVKNEEIDRESIKSFKSAVANVSPIETARNCASANGCLNSTDDDRDSGLTKGGAGAAFGGGGGSGGGGRRDSGAASVKTPSSPALSRISVGGGGGGGDDDLNAGGDVNGGCDVNGRAAEETEAEASEELRPPGRRYGDAHRHHGLPDAIEDAVYRSLQTKRHKHPGLGLNGCWPKCSAVAYKSFNDPGPTQCSKLRVYRPKTSSSPDREKKDSNGHRRRRNGDAAAASSRPKTCVPVVTADQLTDIKLALCWDLDAPLDRNRPPRPPDEPAVFHKVRPPFQQNGAGELQRKPQNTSAVMGFVTTATEADAEVAAAAAAAAMARDDDDDAVGDRREVEMMPEARRTQTRECLMKNRNLSAVMELIPNKDRGHDGLATTTAAVHERDADPRSSHTTVPNKPSSSSSSTCRSKSCPDVNDRKRDDQRPPTDAGSEDARRRSPRSPRAECSSGGRRRHRRRSVHKDAEVEPKGDRCRRRGTAGQQDQQQQQQQQQQQRRLACRPCLACDDPSAGRKDHEECDNHYKMAFKAGVPVSTPIKHRAAAAGKPNLKVPKPKTTNSDKKKYIIGTLLPPFSMWPGTTARDYPEHWRLTSVYRQAFKPLELRKQPLLQTIYL